MKELSAPMKEMDQDETLFKKALREKEIKLERAYQAFLETLLKFEKIHQESTEQLLLGVFERSVDRTILNRLDDQKLKLFQTICAQEIKMLLNYSFKHSHHFSLQQSNTKGEKTSDYVIVPENEDALKLMLTYNLLQMQTIDHLLMTALARRKKLAVRILLDHFLDGNTHGEYRYRAEGEEIVLEYIPCLMRVASGAEQHYPTTDPDKGKLPFLSQLTDILDDQDHHDCQRLKCCIEHIQEYLCHLEEGEKLEPSKDPCENPSLQSQTKHRRNPKQHPLLKAIELNKDRFVPILLESLAEESYLLAKSCLERAVIRVVNKNKPALLKEIIEFSQQQKMFLSFYYKINGKSALHLAMKKELKLENKEDEDRMVVQLLRAGASHCMEKIAEEHHKHIALCKIWLPILAKYSRTQPTLCPKMMGEFVWESVQERNFGELKFYLSHIPNRDPACVVWHRQVDTGVSIVTGCCPPHPYSYPFKTKRDVSYEAVKKGEPEILKYLLLFGANPCVLPGCNRLASMSISEGGIRDYLGYVSAVSLAIKLQDFQSFGIILEYCPSKSDLFIEIARYFRDRFFDWKRGSDPGLEKTMEGYGGKVILYAILLGSEIFELKKHEKFLIKFIVENLQNKVIFLSKQRVSVSRVSSYLTERRILSGLMKDLFLFACESQDPTVIEQLKLLCDDPTLFACGFKKKIARILQDGRGEKTSKPWDVDKICKLLKQEWLSNIDFDDPSFYPPQQLNGISPFESTDRAENGDSAENADPAENLKDLFKIQQQEIAIRYSEEMYNHYLLKSSALYLEPQKLNSEKNPNSISSQGLSKKKPLNHPNWKEVLECFRKFQYYWKIYKTILTHLHREQEINPTLDDFAEHGLEAQPARIEEIPSSTSSKSSEELRKSKKSFLMRFNPQSALKEGMRRHSSRVEYNNLTIFLEGSASLPAEESHLRRRCDFKP